MAAAGARPAPHSGLLFRQLQRPDFPRRHRLTQGGFRPAPRCRWCPILPRALGPPPPPPAPPPPLVAGAPDVPRRDGFGPPGLPFGPTDTRCPFPSSSVCFTSPPRLELSHHIKLGSLGLPFLPHSAVRCCPARRGAARCLGNEEGDGGGEAGPGVRGLQTASRPSSDRPLPRGLRPRGRGVCLDLSQPRPPRPDSPTSPFQNEAGNAFSALTGADVGTPFGTVRGQESCKIDFYPKPFITMDLPDESQWDETTCNLAACQHPQCWATIRRIERGHPRILGSSYKTSLDVNDKLPVLTIVNLSDSCFQARRRPHGHLPGLTFTKPHPLLSQRSKFDSKFQGRPCKDLPDKDLINYTNGSPKGSHILKKLAVLNLNETHIPRPQGVSNMVVVWIPKEPGASVSPAEQYVAPSQDGKKKRKTSTVSSVVLSGKQDRETKLSTPGITVPPPSPVRFFEQLSPEILPFLNQFDALPQDLLNDLLLDEGERSPCLETKTRLATRKKNPLKKSRPESSISAQMFLSVHRLTLQRPSLKYPAHLKKLYYNLNIEDRLSSAARSPGLRKQQQRQPQRKLKTPTKKPKKPEAKKKSKKDPRSQSTSHKSLGPALEKAEWCEEDEQAHVTGEKTSVGQLVDEAEIRGPSLKPQESSKEAESRALCSLCHKLVSAASGHRTLPGGESDNNQQLQMEKNGPILKQDSTERPQVGNAENDLDSFSSKQNPELSKTESSNKDFGPQMEEVPVAQEEPSKDLSSSISRASWNPELHIMRIFQTADNEAEENQLSGLQNKVTPET